MKKSLIIASFLAGTMGVYAQGYLNWNANGTWTISFYSPQTATPGVIQTGDSPLDIPAGSVDYSGGWIGGGNSSPGTGVGATPTFYQNAASFEAGLYIDTSAAAVTSDILTGSPVAVDGISQGALSGISSEAESPLAPGTVVNLGLAAWYTDGGLYGSYAAAVDAQQAAGYNISANQLALGSLFGTPVFIGPGLGLTSFSLATTVPEPGTIGLGPIGAAAFLLRLRRR
jgi:hypothetical protein